MNRRGNVLVFAEQEEGIIHSVVYELLGKGRELADRLGVELSIVLVGHNLKGQTLELIHYGANKVYLFDHPTLGEFDVVRYTRYLVKIVRKINPEIILVGATRIGRSLAPRVAAALGTGLTADCIDLDLDEDGNLVQIRPAFSGNIIAEIKTKTRPQMATVRYKVMNANKKDLNRTGEVTMRTVEVIEDTGLQILEKTQAGEVNLAEAEVIVSGGRGLKESGDFAVLEELASILDGIVGSSRPLVDAGWISKDHQVGFSGHTTKPRVYLACGISGAPQHLFGMRDSDVIIAINEDPSAPIFDVAHYQVVGDIYQIVPVLIKEIKRLRQLRKMP